MTAAMPRGSAMPTTPDAGPTLTDRPHRTAAGRTWPWPLPAVAAWLSGWLVWAGLQALGLAVWPALAVALLVASALAHRAQGRWRRALAAGGFPLSVLVLGAGQGWPAWVWLLATLPLLLAYPVRAWRDAPFFPTPADALAGLAELLPLRPGVRVLDAGCGLGHGLAALQRAYPQARLEGVEWSRPLAWWAARRCPLAQVQRGDMWARSWQGLAMVYLFQRPESMERAWAKARADMAPGSWLVSLEFEVPGQRPFARVGQPQGRPVWVYRLPEAPPEAPAEGPETPVPAMPRSTSAAARR
jgi:hypothetical protein